MPNVWLRSGVRRTVFIFLFWVGNASAWGQAHFGDPYAGGKNQPWFGYPGWGPPILDSSTPNFPRSSLLAPGPATVSADVLRHPLSSKARRLFEKAMHHAELGDHAAAIQGLQEALAKYPSDAPYARNLLGVEYIETRQFSDAVTCFEEAARLMPHESATHFNYGLSLTIVGEWDSAEQEVRKALQLDHSNPKAKLILETLLRLKRTRSARPRP